MTFVDSAICICRKWAMAVQNNYEDNLKIEWMCYYLHDTKFKQPRDTWCLNFGVKAHTSWIPKLKSNFVPKKTNLHNEVFLGRSICYAHRHFRAIFGSDHVVAQRQRKPVFRVKSKITSVISCKSYILRLSGDLAIHQRFLYANDPILLFKGSFYRYQIE